MYRMRKLLKRAAFIALAVVVVLVIAFFAHRSIHANDENLIQGEWQLSDGTMTVVIDSEYIRFPNGLFYTYVMDTDMGTLTFISGERTGSARYSIKNNGNTLVFTEKNENGRSTTRFVKVSDNTNAAAIIIEQPVAEETPVEGDSAVEGEAPVEGESEETPEEAAPEEGTYDEGSYDEGSYEEDSTE